MNSWGYQYGVIEAKIRYNHIVGCLKTASASAQGRKNRKCQVPDFSRDAGSSRFQWLNAESALRGLGMWAKFRVWSAYLLGINLKVAPYSSGGNNIDFAVHAKKLDFTTAATCQDANINFVNMDNSPFTIVLPTGG